MPYMNRPGFLGDSVWNHAASTVADLEPVREGGSGRLGQGGQTRLAALAAARGQVAWLAAGVLEVEGDRFRAPDAGAVDEGQQGGVATSAHAGVLNVAELAGGPGAGLHEGAQLARAQVAAAHLRLPAHGGDVDSGLEVLGRQQAGAGAT